MSRRSAAILTPDPADEGFRSRWRDVLADLRAPLEAAGVDVESRSWAEAGDLTPFDLVMPLLVWGYHRAGEAWERAVLGWEAQGVRLANPGPVLRWNADKAYLGRLARAGAPVVPTLYAEQVDTLLLEQAAERFGTARLVAKPRVSASAWQTIRWQAGAPTGDGPTGAAIVQPYLPAVEEAGEISLIFCGGAFSHAIRKRPQPGDFRVQPEYRGIITRHDPEADELEAAQAVLGAVEEDLLYARVDLVRGLDGAPLLMELELVEPDLYLGYDAGAGSAFASAVAAACEEAKALSVS